MTFLDIFALLVLLILIGSVLAVWALLGMYPGRIARQRKHPQAEAISVCGWWGAITMGILTPVAFIWAYSSASEEDAATDPRTVDAVADGKEGES